MRRYHTSTINPKECKIEKEHNKVGKTLFYITNEEVSKKVDNISEFTELTFIDDRNLVIQNIDYELKKGMEKFYRLFKNENTTQNLVQKRPCIVAESERHNHLSDEEKITLSKGLDHWNGIEDTIVWHFHGPDSAKLYKIVYSFELFDLFSIRKRKYRSF